MSDWVIETNRLGHRYGRRWAVRELDLKVPRGSVYGLLGENGAGKSTTLQMLMGVLLPDAGAARVLDLDPVAQDVAVKSRVGYVPEKYGFYEYMKVSEIIAMVAAYHRGWNRELEQQLVRDFALDEAQKVAQLSKGMRAKLALLLALAFEPDLLILDEPAGGLDPVARRNFIETILRRYQSSGRTILLSSHLLNDFAGLIDHVAFMRDGNIELAASLDQLQQRMKRVRLVFPQELAEAPAISGCLASVSNGRELVATVDDFDQERTLAELQALQPTHVQVEDLSLEEIFVARDRAQA